MKHFSIQLHPFVDQQNPAPPKPQIFVQASWLDHQNLEIQFDINDPLNEIAWGPTAQPINKAISLPISLGQRVDELWKKTCLEVFIAPLNGENYFEFNFAPNGDWNCYQFSSYRKGMSPSDLFEIQIGSPLTFRIRSKQPGTLTPTLRLGLTAVILEKTGRTHYYSISHPGNKPDFHDSKGWQLCNLASNA